MAVSIDVNGVAISYPQAGDVGWAADATQFAVQSSAALSKIGLSTGTNVVVQNTLEVLGDAILQSDLDVVGKLDVDNVEIVNGLIVDTDVLIVDSVNNRVGINNAIPSVDLDVIGDVSVSGTLAIGTLTTTDITIDTDLIKTDSTNNRVGINIAIPTEALDVVGNIKSSGEVLASNGTVSNPSLSFTNDSNSGLYSISDNVIGLAINGTKRGEINTNGLQALDNVLIIEDEKPNNTDGGTFTSGAWRTRVLNSVRVNRITGASLASNQITLPSGTYRIFASAPAAGVNRHKTRLYNVTASSKIVDGATEYATGGTRSIIYNEFTLSLQSLITIEHRCDTTISASGFGIASGFSEPEIYTQVFIQRLA
jgi:hypothetical protein